MKQRDQLSKQPIPEPEYLGGACSKNKMARSAPPQTYTWEELSEVYASFYNNNPSQEVQISKPVTFLFKRSIGKKSRSDVYTKNH